MGSARIVITPGDVAGIGPEVALKAAQAVRGHDLVFAGPEWVWKASAEALGLAMPRAFLRVPELDSLTASPITYGVASAHWGMLAMECVRAAAGACMRGEAAAMVTAPLTKVGIHQAGYRYEGHTDFLAEVTGARRHAMMLSADQLRVVLVTVHQSLRSVAEALRIETIAEKIELAHEACLQLGMPAPRLAVCGLNPHAGESGAFGDEEERIIAPAIRQMAAHGLNVTGPYPADTVFVAAQRGSFDAVVAMYHDQGLIPVKLIGFDHGVNTTLGLPIVRTSPDHGSAYDIAGKGKATFGAMLAAVDMAVRLAGIA